MRQNEENERAWGLNDASIDVVTAAIHRFEQSMGFRSFKKFYYEQAVGFR